MSASIVLRIAAVFSFLCFTTACAAITGVVKDSGTGSALSGVTIYIKDKPSIKTTSDQQGRFTINENANTSYQAQSHAAIGARISADGYLFLSGLTGRIHATMSNVRGVIVWSGNAVCNGTVSRLSLPRPAQGLYFLDVSVGTSRLQCKTVYTAGGYSNFSIRENKGPALTASAAYRTHAVTLVFEKDQYLTKELAVSGTGPVEMLLARQPVPSTGGSGGLTFASKGKAGAYSYGKMMIGIIEVKVFEPADNKPRQLSFYLHGDGAGDYKEDFGFHPGYAAWASKNNVMHVAAMAPNKHSWWRAPEDNGSVEIVDREGKNADAMDSLIKVLGRAYNLYKYPVLYCGVSGGSTFLSRLYLSRYGNRHPGALVMNGGGGDAILKWEWDNKVDSLRNRNWLLFNYGSGDFLKQYIEGGIKSYRALRFSVDSLQHPGEGHCTPGIKIQDNTLAFWGKHLIGRAPAVQDAQRPSLDYEQQRTAWVEGSKRYVKVTEKDAVED